MELEPGMAHMELGQRRDFVTLAEKPRFGRAFLIEARQILAQVDRAALAAQRAASSAPGLRVGVVDASFDPMPQTLRKVQQNPELGFHQVEAGVPERFRLDPPGVLVTEAHRPAASQEVPVAKLAPGRGSCRGLVGAP